MFKSKTLPTIVITGASGFIGRNLVEFLKDKFYIIGIARQSGTAAGIPYHPHVFWVQWDISTTTLFHQVFGYILGKGGADYFIHLAGYYDYDYKYHQEYERTNINGTKNVLELARMVGIREFIFSSSLTVCTFRPKGSHIREDTEPDATFDYAKSKISGEQLIAQYQPYFKCSVVRLAAVYSDWCEFAPLYEFLTCWLSNGWDSRFLAGKGESAMTYIHIHDVCKMILSLIRHHAELPAYQIYVCSPRGATSHRELFIQATRYFFGNSRKPLFVPALLTYPGLLIKHVLGYLRIVKMPHERFWMLRYIDLSLTVDNTLTCELLEWEPTLRFDICRRLLFLVDHMKSRPNIWYTRNQAILSIVTHRPNWMIYEILVLREEEMISGIMQRIYDNENAEIYPTYSLMAGEDLRVYLSTYFHLLLASIRNSERALMIRYIDEVVLQNFTEGVDINEIVAIMELMDQIITGELYGRKELNRIRQDIYDLVTLTLQLARDEIEDIYENLESKLSQYKIKGVPVVFDQKKRDEMIRKLSAFYQEMSDSEVVASLAADRAEQPAG